MAHMVEIFILIKIILVIGTLVVVVALKSIDSISERFLEIVDGFSPWDLASCVGIVDT